MFKWLARIFTIPAAVRKNIDNNPVVRMVAPLVYKDIVDAIDQTISKNISNPTVAASLKSALLVGLEHAGIAPA